MSTKIEPFIVNKLSDDLFYLDQGTPPYLYYMYEDDIHRLTEKHRTGVFVIKMRRTLFDKVLVTAKKVG